MSQYTPYGYGQYTTAPPPLQQYPYQASISYPPPPGYPPAPVNHQPQHYATMAQASYEFNSSIPGLAAGVGPNNSPSSYGSGAPHTSWGQPPPPAHQYHDHQQSTYPSIHPQQQQPPQAYQHTPFFPPQVPSLHSTQPHHPQPPGIAEQHNAPSPYPAMPAEDAELSEGEFEDLYEPHDPEKEQQRIREEQERQRLHNAEEHGRHSTSHQGTKDTVEDAPDDNNNDGSFYGSGSEAGEVPASIGQGAPALSVPEKAGAAPADRPNEEESGSYSPFLSPRQLQQPLPKKPSVNTTIPITTTKSSAAIVSFNSSSSMNIPGLGAALTTPVPKSVTQAPRRYGGPLPTGPGDSQPKPASPSPQDMKNKAKTAILSLWPTIRYQHYVDEGMDPKTVKALFDELGLDTGAPPASRAAPADTNVSKPGSKGEPSPAVTAIPTASSDDKAEARKKRIAHLLALKKGKTATQYGSEPTAQAPAIVSADTESIVAPDPTMAAPKPKPTSKKDLILQQKLDALEKSRAARAQKDAERNNQAQIQGQAASLATPVENPSASVGSPGATSVPAPAASIIPGLVLSSAPASSAYRKRPVASDFDVDLPSTCAKRPFHSPRHNHNSSDNEDVEMDIGSPTEHPPRPTSRSGSLLNKASSSGDFFGLTSNRQAASPTPIAGTPPVSGITTPMNLQGDLERKAKEIEDLKKRIAEAEARKAAQGRQTKKSVAAGGAKSSSPSTAPPAPHMSSPSVDRSGSEAHDGKEGQDGPSAQLLAESAQSIKLPKRSHAARDAAKLQRRERIVSVQLPRLESSVQEKMNKVNLLEQQLLKLRAELRGNLEEKQRLTEEVNRLDAESCNEYQTNGDMAEEVHTETFTAGPSNEHPTSLSGDPCPEQQEQPPSSEPVEGNVPNPECTPPEVDIAQTPAPLNQSGADSESASKSPSAPPTPPVITQPGSSPLLRLDETGKEPGTDLDLSRTLSAGVGGIASPGNVAVGDTEMEDAESCRKESTDAEPSAPQVADNPRVEVIGTELPSESKASPINIEAQDAGMSDVDESGVMPQQISAGSPAIQSDDSKPSSNPRAREVLIVTHHSPVLLQGLTQLQVQRPGIVTQQASTNFLPYDSPLTMFKSFRFHPKFKQAVPGGLKSLTYSNKIDPHKEFCTTELLEGCCSEASCTFQHMKSIVAPEDRILLELGASDIYTGDRKTKFTQGLRALLTELKTKKVRNFEVIANAIIEYRGSFNGDPSKILPLDGVEI